MTSEEKIKQMPHDKLARFRKIYDEFEKKDMPFADFVCELMNLQDESKMQSDLDDMVQRNRQASFNKRTIDGVL